MRAKSLESSQILRAHMPYFRRAGHKYKSCMELYPQLHYTCHVTFQAKRALVNAVTFMY